jgi:Rieske Fe-S protein
VVAPASSPLFGRRAVVATGAVAAGGLVLAGLDAAIGRGAAHDKAAAASGNGVVTVGANSTTIATAAAVDAAGGVEFRQPSTGDPAWVVATGPGQYKAFTAVCTHQGCSVSFDKKSEQFQCPCHGGVYDARTGQVLSGPPPAPLAAIAVKKVDGEIRLA